MRKRTALITGASGVIGGEIALQLAKSGYSVVLGCHSAKGQAVELAARINEGGGNAEVACFDVRSADEVNAAILQAQKKFGFIDTVVTAAGVSHYNLLQDEKDGDYDFVMDINLRGVFNVCRAVLPAMISEKFGRIVNISSIWGISGAANEALYSASKAGVIGLTKALAQEVAPSGITVNAIAAGFIDSPMNANLTEQERAAFISEIPLMRVGKPLDIAKAVLFLADEDSYITAEVLNISGGHTACAGG